MENLESLQFELESLLYTKSEVELKEFAISIKLDVDLSEKSKIAALKIIQKSIDERVVEEGELSEKVSWFKQAIDSLKPDKQNKNESEIALNLIKEQIDTLKQKQQLELDSLMAKFAEAQTNAGQTTVQSAGATKKPIQTPKVVINESINEEGPSNTPLIRREFKISGQIGEPGQTDKLTFVSLTHQIDSGLKRNYKESEIVDAVIRAISLHSSLRSCVETLNDLSLPKLRKILRVHYREKSASELYQHLATIFQQPKETAQQFLLRALDLRNKVGFASKESECEVQYDEPLIQKTFMKPFETGPRDDILAANLRPILRTSGLTDEELMKHVNELASHQAERQNKLACERRLAKVNACEINETEIKQHRHADDDNRILAEIREIRSELESLKRHKPPEVMIRRQMTIGNNRSPHDTAVGGVKRVRSGGLALAASIVSRAENLDISRPNVQKTQKYRETRNGYPAVGTGFSRRCNIPSV
jgi:hypothetical protein